MPLPNRKLTAVLITLNEAERLGACLSSVQWMDEIVVVDSGSTDGTRDIAKYYTNNFFHRAFDEYASQKNFGAQQAKNDWVFSIDADEVMTPELRFEIQALLKD